MSDLTSKPLVVPADLEIQGRAERRARRRHTFVVAVVVTIMVGLPVAWLSVALGDTSDGSLTHPAGWSNQGVRLLESVPADPSPAGSCPPGLQTDDLVTHIDGDPVEAWVSGGRPLAAPRGEVTYTVSRDGETCDYTLRLGPYPWAQQLSKHVLVLPLVVVMWLVGAFVFLQRPHDRGAQALFALAVLVPWASTMWPFGPQAVDLALGPRLWPLMVGELASALLWGAVLHFALVFPRPVPLLERRLSWLAATYAVPFLLYLGSWGVISLANLSRGGGGELDRLGTLLAVSLPSARVVPFLVAGIVWWQYAHARDPAERRRVRWVLYTLMLCAVTYLGLGQIPDLYGAPLVPYDWLLVVFVTMPIALGVAVLQYGIFDLQILLRRSLVFGALTTVLVAIPAAAGVLLANRLSERPSTLSDPVTLNVVLGIALVVALFFQGLRRLLKRRVSRLIFGARDDPYEVIRQLGARLQTDASPDTVLTMIAETVASALRLPYVAIELVGSERGPERASFGTPTADVQAVSLAVRGDEVGRLLLGSGARTEPFGPADHRLLELLAQQVATAAENVVLAARLQRSLETVITVRDEERNRLRKDIHDGLGPTVTGSRFRLEAVRQMLATDPATAATVLDEVVRIQQSMLDELRRIVHNIRPPVIDQLGLAGAIRDLADSFSHEGQDAGGFRVTVEAPPDLRGMPGGVEVAAYHIVTEALANAARHSGARHCRVLIRRDDTLVIEVSDDGAGIPDDHRAGVGLTSMRERASEMGGTCTITSKRDRGTVVLARIPIFGSR